MEAEMSTPTTQTQYPWRATVRTVFQAFVGLCAFLPLVVNASGLDQTTGAVVVALAVSGAVTKIMNIPAVNDWITKYLPWLAAEPKSKPIAE
jgi:hypothetical protein